MKTLLISFLVFLLTLMPAPVSAQWIPSEGLDGAYVNDLLVKDSPGPISGIICQRRPGR
jgi:hypothetical protein